MRNEELKRWFSAAVIYGAGHWLIDGCIVEIMTARGIEALTAGFEILFWTTILIILICGKEYRRWKIAIPECPGTGLWLLTIPLAQYLVFGLQVHEMVSVLLILGAVLGEEMVFRSLVPLYLKEKMMLSDRNRMLICASVFAMFHLVDLFYAEMPGMVVMQGLYAFSAGLGFHALAEKQNSILPGVALHFLINLTAAENVPIRREILLMVLFSGLFLTFGIIFTLKKEKQTHETLH